MSAVQERPKDARVKGDAIVPSKASPSLIDRGLQLLSSVRFGVSLLVLLVIACMIGMLIMQQNVAGFDKYYAELTPSQRLLYGKLGFFDIYHVWYFNALLVVLSLNIVLASIDRFPKAWTFISRPKLDASAAYLRGQKQTTTLLLEAADSQAVAARVAEACRSVRLKPRITEKNNRTFVFAERGAWNRLGAYAVHVALLTIFLGGFLTSQFGYTGNMRLAPGDSQSAMSNIMFKLDQVANVPIQLPFTVTCTDIEQKLIKKDGSILADNTLDWLTRIKIKDEHGEREALVNLNHPYDYRGYRFFQAEFDPRGSARQVTLRVTPLTGESPQDVTIKRNGSATLNDGTRINYVNFFSDFTLDPEGKPVTVSSDYSNPTAQLRIADASGQLHTVYATQATLPFDQAIKDSAGGYNFRLADYEKVSQSHTLSIQHDPGVSIVYLGFGLLFLTLSAVFFFSHERVWALIEERPGNQYEVVLGGNTNRNQPAFEDRFGRLTAALNKQSFE